MASEPDAIRLLRLQQSKNRLEAAQTVQRDRGRQKNRLQSYDFVGRNADGGTGIVRGFDGTEATGQITTSGLLKTGQRVRVGVARQMLTIDHKPHVRRVKKVIDTPKFFPATNLKTLIRVNDAATGEIKFYVAGWQKQSVLVRTLDAATLASSPGTIEAYVDNPGGDDWAFNLRYGKTTERITSTNNDWTSTQPVTAGSYYGNGLWFSSRTQVPLSNSTNVNSSPAGADPRFRETISSSVNRTTHSYIYEGELISTIATSNYSERDYAFGFNAENYGLTNRTVSQTVRDSIIALPKNNLEVEYGLINSLASSSYSSVSEGFIRSNQTYYTDSRSLLKVSADGERSIGLFDNETQLSSSVQIFGTPTTESYSQQNSGGLVWYKKSGEEVSVQGTFSSTTPVSVTGSPPWTDTGKQQAFNGSFGTRRSYFDVLEDGVTLIAPTTVESMLVVEDSNDVFNVELIAYDEVFERQDNVEAEIFEFNPDDFELKNVVSLGVSSSGPQTWKLNDNPQLTAQVIHASYYASTIEENT